MTGKLNGVMPATTPTGCRTVCTSSPVDDLRAVRALEQVRDPARELDALEAAVDLALRVGEHLAVLARDQPPPGRRGAARPARGDGRARRRAGSATTAPVAGRVDGELHGVGDLGRRGERDLARLHAACGVEHGPDRPESPATARPPIQWPIVFIAVSVSGSMQRARGARRSSCGSTLGPGAERLQSVCRRRSGSPDQPGDHIVVDQSRPPGPGSSGKARTIACNVYVANPTDRRG